SPGITHPPSRLCLSDLRCTVPCKFWALQIVACSPQCNASYPLPVRQASVLPSASFRFPVTRNTLAVWLTLPLAGRVEDLHLLVGAPCRAHNRKRPLAVKQGAFSRLKYYIFSYIIALYSLEPMRQDAIDLSLHTGIAEYDNLLHCCRQLNKIVGQPHR
ncbi:hypothetical protein SAMN02745220_03238, partial [Desulfopila aestuarii DSM 18488]